MDLINKKGEIYVTVCILILVVMIIFSVITVYSSAITLVKLQKENTEIVFDSFITQNSIIIFNNIKQGKNITDNVNVNNFCESLKEFCTLDEHNGKLYSYDANGDEKYSITIPSVEYIEDGKLELYASYTMFVPIRFAGKTVSTATVPIKISSSLTSKN